MEGKKEDWYGNNSYRIEDIGGTLFLDKISPPSKIGENENTDENIPKKVSSEIERNTDVPASHSPNPALKERSQHQHEENNSLADGNKNSDLAALILSSSSSKELPSWAMRQTASVPPNTHRIAECQGCMKEHGAPHTCDMREEVPSRYSDLPSGVYPNSSNRHSMIPPTIMNPYAPAWSEGHEVCPPSWRHPPLPPWRQDQNSYHSHQGYEKHYCEDCEDEYIRHYPLDACGRRYIHEAPRGPQPHDAYVPHINRGHSYGAMHDPAFLRPRHMEEHPPPPSHFHQYSARKYPLVPLSGQGLMGSEWQGRSIQNSSIYEPLQVFPDIVGDRKNSRGDWPQIELEQSTRNYDTVPHPDISSLSRSGIHNIENQINSQSDKNEYYQTHSLAGDFNTKAATISETKTSSEQLQVASSREGKINFNEKNTPAHPTDDLTSQVISSSTSSNNKKTITLHNDPADSHTAAIEEVKSDEGVLSVRTSTADMTTADIVKQEVPIPYTRKSPCAFTIDISPIGSSAADPFSVPKLPANLAKRVAKFPRKQTPKDDKSEKALQANMTVIQPKKNSSLYSIKQSSKVKQPQNASRNNTEDDDYDEDCRETYQDRLRWSKPMVWTKVEANSQKNEQYFKSPESDLRGASVTTSKVKSNIQRDGSHNGKINKSLEFERSSLNKENPSVATRNYTSLQKFSNYPEENHNVTFQTDDDTSSEVSETETYTICTADTDSSVTAAREKIGEVFRVGIRDDMLETEVQNIKNELQRNSYDIAFIDDEKNPTEEEALLENHNSPQPQDGFDLDSITDMTTAVKAYKRNPEDILQKSHEDSCLNMQDSDDVICLTYDSNKAYLGDRKSNNDMEMNLVSSFPLPPIRGSSLSKRLLPRIPGQNGRGDCAALVFQSADTKSNAGDSDTGFFEVLSSDAPILRPAEKKKAGRLELSSCFSETYQKLHNDGEFEVIADAPKLVKETSQNDDTLDLFQKNKVLKNSLNKRGPTNLCQPEDDELTKIFSDAHRSGRVFGMTATDEHEFVSVRKPTTHTVTGKLHSIPRFNDTLLPNETSLNHSQKPSVCNSITTSKSQTILNRTNNKDKLISGNEGFMPISYGRSSVRSEGRKLPGSPAKPMNNTKSEFIFRSGGGLSSGGKGSLNVTHREGYDSSGTSSVSQPSTPRLTQRVSSTQRQRLTENMLESRPPLSGSRQKTVVSKAVSHGSTIVAEPGTPSGTPSGTPYARQRSLSRPMYSRGDPQISLSRPPLSKDDPTRQQPQSLKHSSLDRSDMTASLPPSRSKQNQVFKGQWIGEIQVPEKATSFDNEARMKRSKSASTGLRSRTSDVENPKLQAYHERMKYDPKKAIQDSKKLRLSASSRSDDTDASSHEELQNHHLSRHRPGSMTHSDRHSRKTNDYQPRSSLKQSGTRPRSARTRMSSDDGLNHSTSSDGIRSTTVPSIQNLSEDIHEILDKIKQEKTRSRPITQVTSLSANRGTASVDDPQLNELRKTLNKVKQVLQSKFHS